METEVTRTVRAVRTITTFDQRLDALQLAFAEARERVLAELKDDLKDPSSFVKIVVACLQAIGASAAKLELHAFERDDLVSDLVKDIVTAMPISEDDKRTLVVGSFPMIEGITKILLAASKGYLFLQKYRPTQRPTQRRTREEAVTLTPAPTPAADLNALVNDVYNTLETMLRIKKVTVVNVISIASTVMQIIEQYPQVPGPQKKQIALSVLHRVVAGLDMTDDEKAVLDLAINTTVSATIEFIIKASRGEIEFINQIVEQVKGCFASCKKK